MGEPLYQPRDLAHNNLAAAVSVPVVGYIEPAYLLEPDKLNQTVYSFLLRSIREDDQKNGKLLERYLQGTQDVWEIIQKRLFELKTLWSVSDIEDELLIYLKNIVGWTKELEYITNRMEYDQLRRLISISVALWKAKGPEDIIEDLLRYTLQTRVYMTNWFDYRWILGEGYLSFDEAGTDVWVLDVPEEGTEQYYSTLKIVDDGTLDRTLTRYLINLLRACGERIEVRYMDFIDLFDVDGDTEQWNAYNGELLAQTELVVENGIASLSNDVTSQAMVISSKNTFNWPDYSISTKIRSGVDSTGLYGLWLHAVEAQRVGGMPRAGHYVQLDPVNNLIWFKTNAVTSSVSYSPWGTLQSDTVYDLTVHVTDVDGADMEYKIYIDSVLVMTVVKGNYRLGYIGIMHEEDAILEVSSIEVSPLPYDSELIDINS